MAYQHVSLEYEMRCNFHSLQEFNYGVISLQLAALLNRIFQGAFMRSESSSHVRLRKSRDGLSKVTTAASFMLQFLFILGVFLCSAVGLGWVSINLLCCWRRASLEILSDAQTTGQTTTQVALCKTLLFHHLCHMKNSGKSSLQMHLPVK